MTKITHSILAVLFIFLVDSTASVAQTAEELERNGLEHFRKAYYEAVPKKEKARATDEFDRAEKAFTQAIRKKPKRVEPYLHLGRSYFVQKKYRQAAQVYKNALSIDPFRKPTYLQLASACEMMGDYRAAADALKQLRTMEDDEEALLVLDEFISRMEDKIVDRTAQP